MTVSYDYPHPAVTVDCVVFGLDDEDLKILLIQRDLEPFRDQWALPGGFLRLEEDLEETARRELFEEAGLLNIFLEQLFTFGKVKRDPRERVITVAYFSLVNIKDHQVRAATNARDVAWFSVTDLPTLAFDHDEIYETALTRLKGKVRYQPIGFELLPKKFALSQLQHLYETILERSLDKRNFRKKILKMSVLLELDEIQQDVAHRAARLYSFDKRRYEELVEKGFNFEI